MNLCGPFQKSDIKLTRFVNNMTKTAVFQKLLAEMEEIEKFLESADGTEKAVAEMLHEEIDKQILEMISFGETDDERGTKAPVSISS